MSAPARHIHAGIVAAHDDLAWAQELERSLLEQHPEATCTIWICGPDDAECELVGLVGASSAPYLAQSLEPAAQAEALRPAALYAVSQAMSRSGEAGAAIVVPARSRVVDLLDDLVNQLALNELAIGDAGAMLYCGEPGLLESWVQATLDAGVRDADLMVPARHHGIATRELAFVRPENARILDLRSFNPERPWLLEDSLGHLVSITTPLSKHPDLARICRAHAEVVLASVGSLDLEIERLPDRWSRAAVRRALATGERPPLDDLQRWLQEPVGALARVNRYLYEVWVARADLQAAHPAIGSSDQAATGFLDWVEQHGNSECGVAESMLPTVEACANRWTHHCPSKHGVRVVGHLRGELGVGEAGRQVAAGVARARVPNATWTYRQIPARQGHDFEDHADGLELYDVNLVCINADGLPAFAFDVGEGFFAGRYTIGVWFWETTSPPPALVDALTYIDELWVASEFIEGVLRPHVEGVPIRVMPLAVRAPEPGPTSRADLGLPEDAYLYGFMFDFNSTLERKNTLGLVDAYRRAYPEPSEGTALVIKSMHGEQNLRELEQLRFAIMDRPDIQLIDEHLSIADRDAMLAHLDCYVSLHRSEGFGLTIAEALLAGIPTIATGYSANVEFAGADVCYLVEHEMCEVPEGLGPYPAGGQWAQPSVEHAAKLMLHVRANETEARAKAAAGAASIAEQCSLDAAAAFMRSRLNEIWKDRPMPPPEPLPEPDPIGDVERFVAGGPDQRWLKGRGPRALIQRAVRRVLQPYTTRQQQFERDVARSLRALQSRTDKRDV